MARAELDPWFPLAHRNGETVPIGALTVHMESQAMRYGLSVFEGLRGYVPAAAPGSLGRPVVFAVKAHLDRLAASAELAGLLPAQQARDTVDRIGPALDGLLDELSPSEDVYVRVALSAASIGALGEPAALDTTITVRPMGRKPALRSGAGLTATTGPRKGPGELLSHQCKCISHYAGARRALLAARSAGFDTVLLRGPDGQLAEAPTANLMVVSGREVVTPALSDGVLAGITRNVLMGLAAKAGLAVAERAIWPDELTAAEEALLCGTGLEIVAIRSFAGRQFPTPGPVTKELTRAYFELVRGEESG